VREVDVVAAQLGLRLRGRAAGAPGGGRVRRTAPATARSLCQGDVNVFNYLFRKGRWWVVDREQARISDPRCDVASCWRSRT
jgi:hypothetical protein